MIRFDNVTFRYSEDRPPAIADLSVVIGSGERVAVMGANGSGKSTFARLLAGLYEPLHGRVIVGGERSDGPTVGILFQNPDNQMVAVTVEKEIAFVLENLGIASAEIERRVGETLKRFGIEHLRRRLTAELSGGEKQRVALASVMISEPTVLVMDEPDSYLDQAGKEALWAELESLQRSRPEMVQIHVTQYPYMARQYPRLLVFDGGRLVADKPPERVFADDGLCRRTAIKPVVRDAGDTMPLPASKAGRPVEPGVTRIELRDVEFSYGGAEPVLKPLSAAVESGKTIGVVGPSGSGKSTMGLLLCGLLEPTGGTMTAKGEDGQNLSPEDIRGQVSMVLQQPERQFFLPTCTEEVAFGPNNVGPRLDSEDTAAMLASVGLEPEQFGQRDPFRLSGGEKRRLAFAVVLAMQPRIVVFDEPTCALDQEGVARFIALARALKRAGTGMVVISHDGDVIRSLADDVLQFDGAGGCQMLSAERFFRSSSYASVVSPLTWSAETV